MLQSTPDTGTTFETIHGVKLIRADDMVIAHQERTRAPFEAATLSFWDASQRPDRWAVDVGAYTGLFAIRAARLGFGAVAFEPNLHAYHRMRQNIDLNEVSVITAPLALGARSGFGKLDSPNGRPLTSASRLTHQGGGVEVPVASLDEILASHMRVSVIKIDVEGSELGVLLGALRTLIRDRPNLILEANTNGAKSDIYRFLGTDRWRFEDADSRNILVEPI